MLAMPGGDYVTHVTPADGTGRALAREVVDVIREQDSIIRVIGTDGCPVNTGIHTGAVQLIEIETGNVVQHVVCGLHLNELVFWHILSETDGVTKAKDKLSGPVGSTLHLKVWEQPVIAFQPISGKVPLLPPEVVKDLSHDQAIGYRYCHAIGSGVIPDSLVTQTIGPLVTSRWNTTANRILCLYTRSLRPSKKLQRLTRVVLLLYYPGWFKFKAAPHIQDGSLNFFYVLELTRDLPEEDRMIAQRVLQDNSFWAHTENLLISMMKDEDKEIRRRAVLWILRARKGFCQEDHPRQFVPPKLNFQVALPPSIF